MNSNTKQVNEDYKFRISYVLNFFKDMFSTSGQVEDKELNDKIEKIRKEQDSIHMSKLEKELEIHEVHKKKAPNRTSTIINDVVEEDEILKNNEIILDEEKDR